MNRFFYTVRSARLVPVLAALLIAPAAHAQETVGFALINRAFNGDTAGGVDVIANQSFTQAGKLSHWSFFSNATDRPLPITPFIAQLTGGDVNTNPIFTITGIGATRTNAGTGVQTFDFNLSSGSATVGSGFYFGFHGGTTTTGTAGAVELTTAVSGTNPVFLYLGNNSIGVGNARSGNNGFRDRNYSFQGTATGMVSAAAPEPGSITLALLGGLPIVGVVSRRKRARRAA